MLFSQPSQEHRFVSSTIWARETVEDLIIQLGLPTRWVLGLARTVITHWQVIHISHAFIYWPSILCCLYLYLTTHSIPVLSLSLSFSLSLSLALARLCTCHSSISSYQIWNSTSACFFTHIYFLPPTSWKRQTIYEKKEIKNKKKLKIKKKKLLKWRRKAPRLEASCLIIKIW